MPTIPLYNTRHSVHLDAWHSVRSPGGYEWWYFDAEDDAADVQVVAILFDGFAFHPGYLRAYGRYLRKATRCAPPVAAQYPCAYMAVYEKGELLAQFMTQYPAGSLSASAHEPQVSIGPNSFKRQPIGNLSLEMQGTPLQGPPWRLTARGPRLLGGTTLSASLTFIPRYEHAPVGRTFLSRAMTGADHHWVIADPLSVVEGNITLAGDTNRSINRSIRFLGRGYHDHNYGTAPPGQGLRRWIRGRILFRERAYCFHFARPRQDRLHDEIHLLEADEAGIRRIDVDGVGGGWTRMTRSLLAYPPVLKIGSVVQLEHLRVVHSSPFNLRLNYDAICRGQKGTAFCEVMYPHRLRWPILGRMIERSIDRSAP